MSKMTITKPPFMKDEPDQSDLYNISVEVMNIGEQIQGLAKNLEGMSTEELTKHSDMRNTLLFSMIRLLERIVEQTVMKRDITGFEIIRDDQGLFKQIKVIRA